MGVFGGGNATKVAVDPAERKGLLQGDILQGSLRTGKPPPTVAWGQLQPGTQRYRVIIVTTFVFFVLYMGWRCGNFTCSWLSTLMFFCEWPVYIWMFLAATERWSPVESIDSDHPPHLPAMYPTFPVDEWPEVDILVPTYNEPRWVLEATLIAASRLIYPKKKLKVYVLDDGARDWLKDFCREVFPQMEYVARPKPKGVPHYAKAGNLNYCFRNYRMGDMMAILDADMVVDTQFVLRLAPYFYSWNEERQKYEKNDLCLLQTPQRFWNVRPEDRIDYHQTVWYDITCCGRDSFSAVPFCGSNAMLSCDAVRDVGGFATEGLTEDLHTSLRMLMKGWRSRYLRESWAVGLAPWSLASAFSQRLRWAVGSLQMVRAEKIFASKMSWRQKIAMWMLGGNCYFFPFTLIFFFLPVISTWTHTPVFPDPNYASYILPTCFFVFSRLMTFVLPGDAPLHLVWRDLSANITYMPLNAVGFFMVYMGLEIPFKTTDKQHCDPRAGRMHPLNISHIMLTLVILITCIYRAYQIRVTVIEYQFGTVGASIFTSTDFYNGIVTLFWLVYALIHLWDVLFAMILPDTMAYGPERGDPEFLDAVNALFDGRLVSEDVIRKATWSVPMQGLDDGPPKPSSYPPSPATLNSWMGADVAGVPILELEDDDV